jgi:hypothetical protein
MSKQQAAFVNAAAAVNDYYVNPRLEYKTIAGIFSQELLNLFNYFRIYF